MDILAWRRLEREAKQVRDKVSHVGQTDERHVDEQIALARRAMRRSGGFRTGSANASRPMALSIILTVCEQTLGIRPSNTQILESLAMNEGYIVQSESEEGRNVSIAMAAILYAWSGSPCHIVSTSSYRATSDAFLMRPLFTKCGCRTAAISQAMPVEEIREAYEVDILYATSRQFLSDFMRDQVLLNGVVGSLRRRLREMRAPADVRRPVMKGTFVAIVDDVGAILIDEATSPMTISAPGSYSVLEIVAHSARLAVSELQPGRDYELIYQPNLVIRYTVEGESRLEECGSKFPPFWRHEKRCEDAITAAILAREVFQRDRHYAIQEQRIVILDEALQKMMSGQSWHFGVIQAIEAKEGLELSIPPRTIARTAAQEFFSHYQRVCGSGSELREFRNEFWRSYELRLLCLPSRKIADSELVCVSRSFANHSNQIEALVAAVEQFRLRGLPVIVVTRRDRYAVEIVAHLAKLAINCNVLSGRDPDMDAQTFILAGGPSCVTVVTGLLWRLPNAAIEADIAALGGIQVLLFENSDTIRADRLIYAWVARQRPCGQITVFLSLDDDLLNNCPALLAIPLRFVATHTRFRGQCLRVLAYLSRWNLRRQIRRHRALMLERESQLDQQLAFLNKLSNDSEPRF